MVNPGLAGMWLINGQPLWSLSALPLAVLSMLGKWSSNVQPSEVHISENRQFCEILITVHASV